MADQATIFGASGRTDDDATLAELEVDYTPVGAALQLVMALRQSMRPTTTIRRALCPAAGSGVFVRALRALDPGIVVDANDARQSEYDNIVSAVSGTGGDASFGDFERWITYPPKGRKYDLVIDNPPFKWFKTGIWEAIFGSGMVRKRGLVAFLGLSQWGQSEEAWPMMCRRSPILQIRLGGRLAFRPAGETSMRPIPKDRRVQGGPTHEPKKNGTDQREYSLWVWSESDEGRIGWHTVQLPTLPAELRSWSSAAVPGTYPIDKALVERVRSFL